MEHFSLSPSASIGVEQQQQTVTPPAAEAAPPGDHIPEADVDASSDGSAISAISAARQALGLAGRVAAGGARATASVAAHIAGYAVRRLNEDDAVPSPAAESDVLEGDPVTITCLPYKTMHWALDKPLSISHAADAAFSALEVLSLIHI